MNVNTKMSALYISIIYTSNLGLGIAVLVREREQGIPVLEGVSRGAKEGGKLQWLDIYGSAHCGNSKWTFSGIL